LAPVHAGVTTKLVATAFALCGFAVAVVAGLAAGNPGTRVLGTALICMLLCQCAGMVVGIVGERVVAEYMASYKRRHPLPGAVDESSPQSSQKS
jgi:putative Mn2+ efflux pump MntP